MKKGELHWDELGKVIIALIVLIVIILIIWFLRDKLYSFIPKLKAGI